MPGVLSGLHKITSAYFSNQTVYFKFVQLQFVTSSSFMAGANFSHFPNELVPASVEYLTLRPNRFARHGESPRILARV